MSTSELACSYAALILYDDGIPITAERIAALVKAADVKIESYWPGLFAKLFEKRNIEDFIFNVGSGPAATVANAAASISDGTVTAVAAASAEEEKEEPKMEVEEEEDMGFFSLFD